MAKSSVRYTLADWRGDRVTPAVQDLMVPRQQEAAEMLKSQMAASIKPSATVSAPGQPPRSVSGQLKAGFTSRVTRNRNGVLSTVGNTAPYAGYLEHGTRNMAARPFMRPVFERSRKRILAILGRKGAINIGGPR